jgi:NAD(P)-dependent dehydrogenase (short-subunit alcohol dehydrogenase family)
MTVKGKIALVTGAATGIGAALAKGRTIRMRDRLVGKKRLALHDNHAPGLCPSRKGVASRMDDRLMFKK